METKLKPRLTWRLREIAEMTGTDYQWLHAKVKQGKLKAIKVDGILLVPDAELKKFLGMDK